MKNLSKKILIASLAAVTAASVLAGCGGEKGGSGSAKGDTIKIG
ncbi:MAG TPA: C4-dicarboxylate ABC transporter substrate-binding protein, partial [Veillonellaceae bacterium]|nr:C4-dicarboxylate ABC transporter substrate-binding protein [Veillonellaceae bacterium]